MVHLYYMLYPRQQVNTLKAVAPKPTSPPPATSTSAQPLDKTEADTSTVAANTLKAVESKSTSPPPAT
jgi:hypothetical protein